MICDLQKTVSRSYHKTSKSKRGMKYVELGGNERESMYQ